MSIHISSLSYLCLVVCICPFVSTHYLIYVPSLSTSYLYPFVILYSYLCPFLSMSIRSLILLPPFLRLFFLLPCPFFHLPPSPSSRCALSQLSSLTFPLPPHLRSAYVTFISLLYPHSFLHCNIINLPSSPSYASASSFFTVFSSFSSYSLSSFSSSASSSPIPLFFLFLFFFSLILLYHSPPPPTLLHLLLIFRSLSFLLLLSFI